MTGALVRQAKPAPAPWRLPWSRLPRSATCLGSASIPIGIAHGPDEVSGRLLLRLHGVGQRPEPLLVDRLAGRFGRRQPRDRLASPGDLEGIAGFDAVNQLAEMRLGVGEAYGRH